MEKAVGSARWQLKPCTYYVVLYFSERALALDIVYMYVHGHVRGTVYLLWV
jgi:hypothetical protein